MSAIIDRLVRKGGDGEARSYIIGLERGRTWADQADYFDIRWLSELKDHEFALPHGEESYFRALLQKTALEMDAYVRGWKAGVAEMRREYVAIL